MLFGIFKNKKQTRPDVAKILVPAEAFTQEAHVADPAMAVVNYVNALLNEGLYRRDEIPAEAMWIYHADYYVAQVKNGGHSQFLGNSGMSEWTLSDAEKGMRLIGADAYGKCLRDTLKWARANPGLAKQQNGFENRARALDEIDSAFFGEDDEAYYSAIGDWLRTSEKVMILDQAQLPQEMTSLKEANPERAQRKSFAELGQLNHGLIDTVLATYRAVLGARVIDGKLIKALGITAGVPMGHPEDKNGTIWGVQTTVGVLAGYETQSKYKLCKPTSDNGFGAGEVIFEANKAQADQIIAFSKSVPIASVAQKLLSLVNRSERFVYITPASLELQIRGKQTSALYVGNTENDKLFTLGISDAGAQISPVPPTSVMARISSKQLHQLTEQVDAYNSYVPIR